MFILSRSGLCESVRFRWVSGLCCLSRLCFEHVWILTHVSVYFGCGFHVGILTSMFCFCLSFVLYFLLEHMACVDVCLPCSMLSCNVKSIIMLIMLKINRIQLKVVWSGSGEKSAQIKHCLKAKTVHNSSKQMCVWIWMWDSTGEAKYYNGLCTHILVRRDCFKLKHLNDGFVYFVFSMDWSGVDYCDVLSAVWSLILTAPIHWRVSIAEEVMQCYISPNLMKKQTHLRLGWPEF